ncbi:alpha-ketoglutarate-dependent dioxygenase alkB homolog 7, mitochondrial isoform X1 [Neodiprion fabricii]|uniref:alpha-ketoglutarate-dependent dioxygenase alkB homolog 7, mitochondrial isoform X1 n=2 Tax=Neodiprion fabricii TaxID=2872261 RepID=UPI001ED8D888|nr:alpha-ketoglutarate-dependent dioxygenase alkB homolog 7, mitochondrial isoform X1 [Neodiprion fabricii]
MHQLLSVKTGRGMLSRSVLSVWPQTLWMKSLGSNLMNSGSRRSTKTLSSDWMSELSATMRIFPDFITPQEEESLFQEIEPYLKRLRYESSHWDNAIQSYRETEKSTWNKGNSAVIQKIQKTAFPPDTSLLGHVHVLDLAGDGMIKPHVDSVRFCGDTIAGLSLLSDSVMRLTMVGYEKECFKDYLLLQRSLYVMSGAARYKYNHEILGPDESTFEGNKIPRSRRISVICRCDPKHID